MTTPDPSIRQVIEDFAAGVSTEKSSGSESGFGLRSGQSDSRSSSVSGQEAKAEAVSIGSRLRGKQLGSQLVGSEGASTHVGIARAKSEMGPPLEDASAPQDRARGSLRSGTKRQYSAISAVELESEQGRGRRQMQAKTVAVP